MNIASLRTLALSKLHNQRFLRNSGLLMLANIIVTALALIRTPTVTWLLPKEEVGMIGVVGAWLSFILLLSLPGLDSASYHYVVKGSQWAFLVNIRHKTRWALLSTVAFVCGAGYWWWRDDPALSIIFLIAGAVCPIVLGLSACSGTLAAREKFGALFWYRIADSLTDFVGFIPLLFSIWWINRAITFYTVNQLATMAMLGFVAWWLVKELPTSERQAPDKAVEREMIRYGQHLTLIAALGVVQSQVDSLLVSALLPLTVMADYAIATMIYNQIKTLWGVYLSVRYPVFVRLALARRRRRMLWEGGLVWVGFAITGGMLYLVALWLIPLLLPDSYRSSLPYIGLLILAFLTLLPGAFVEVYFRTEQDQRQQYILRGASATAGVLLPSLMISNWGVIGVAFGRILAGVVFSVVGLWLFWRSGQSITEHSIR
ncbi:MAG: oligosaccharide flippase family protein [Caldilineaceae bacterium]|nr:oligosaccharide flippase family protein [Caldilineaceae bacterium]